MNGERRLKMGETGIARVSMIWYGVSVPLPPNWLSG